MSGFFLGDGMGWDGMVPFMDWIARGLLELWIPALWGEKGKRTHRQLALERGGGVLLCVLLGPWPCGLKLTSSRLALISREGVGWALI